MLSAVCEVYPPIQVRQIATANTIHPTTPTGWIDLNTYTTAATDLLSQDRDLPVNAAASHEIYQLSLLYKSLRWGDDMHSNMIGSTGMDQDSHLAHDNTYANDHWADMNPYNQLSLPPFAGNYYMPPVTHSLPSESIGGHMAPPPVPQQIPHQQHHQHHPFPSQQLPHPLIIPPQPRAQVPWPSLQTNPGQSYSAPPVAIPPQTALSMKPQAKLPSLTTSQPRKTLTEDDRRRMCQYAEDNPNMKQTEIGAKFGVERSTVSKVLRKKDQYLHQEERSSSPVKRAKGKSADFERTLVQWVRNRQHKGFAVSDHELEDQARLFFKANGSPESPLKIITGSWLEKFKHKHGIGPGKLVRRASETAIPDSAKLAADSPIMSASQTPGGVSPSSPAVSPSTKKDALAGYMDFENSPYNNPNSQSTTSLSSAVTDPASSTFSGSAFSPTSQFTFSPDPNTGMFDQRGIPPGSSNFQRPRSQTFPTLDLEFAQSQTTEPLTPKYSVSGTAPSSALESPAHELPAPSYGLDQAISPPSLHHSRSNSSLGGRSSNTPIMANAVTSSPGSPTQEDARRAADTLLSFMQHMGSASLVNNEEYATIVRLTERLKLHQQQFQGLKPSVISAGMGGLSRIPEGDTEMPNVPTNMTKSDEAIMTG